MLTAEHGGCDAQRHAVLGWDRDGGEVSVFHLVLGVAVVALCLAAGVLGLMGRTDPRVVAIGGWGVGALVIQSATGMFMLTATTEAPALHVVLALAGLAVVLLVRLALPDAKPSTTGAAFLFAASTSVVAFVTGVAAA